VSPTNAGLGQRTGMQAYDIHGNVSNSANWEYDHWGRVVTERRQINGQTYQFQFGYSQGGLPTTIVYPGGSNGEAGEMVITNYHWQTGQPRSMNGAGTYVADADYEHPGQLLTRLELANNITTDFTYDPLFRLNRIIAHSDNYVGNALHFNYTYDTRGNIIKIMDYALPGISQTKQFAYDDLQRLVAAVTMGNTAGAYQESVQYDAAGNIISKSLQEYTYAEQTNQLTHIQGERRFWYDEAGNMTQRLDMEGRSWRYSWNGEDKLLRATNDEEETFNFIYDADGMLIMRVEALGSATVRSTIMLGKLFTHDSVEGSRKQYMFNGRLIAERAGLRPLSNVSFFLLDHLGSVNVTLWADGSARANKRYNPWGEELWSVDITPTMARFTAQRWDAGLGLLDYNARYYDPVIGRFLTADTLIPGTEQTALAVNLSQDGIRLAAKSGTSGPGPMSSQSLNRYSYAANSPPNYIDPSGHTEVLFEGDVTVEQAKEMLQGLEIGLDILDEALNNISAGTAIDWITAFALMIGTAANIRAIKDLSLGSIGRGAYDILKNLHIIAGGLLGGLTATSGEVTAGVIGTAMFGTLLAAASALLGLAAGGVYTALRMSLSQTMKEFRGLYSDLNSIIQIAEANNNAMIHVSMARNNWNKHRVAFSTTSPSGKQLERATILSRTPLQMWGFSTKDALLATWPSIMSSRTTP
jgi:RHS repeat-associated protein